MRSNAREYKSKYDKISIIPLSKADTGNSSVPGCVKETRNKHEMVLSVMGRSQVLHVRMERLQYLK